jgi:ankyrin repeat protein
MLHTLLQHDDINVNAQDSNGNTPLHWAIKSAKDNDEQKCLEIVQMLLTSSNLDLRLRNSDHKTATGVAFAKRFMIVVRMLMERESWF